nr:hypothetical protein [Tanacetum cinerariifolium]GFA24504.1 hypothetical protein [Tanacetum cinerariifolium]
MSKETKEVTNTQEYKDGFMEVERKKGKAKALIKPRQVEGIKLTKPKLNLQYQRVDKGETSIAHGENKCLRNVDEVMELEIPLNTGGATDVGASTPTKNWTYNGAWCSKGTRIILGWNSNVVDVNVVSQDDQAMHNRVWIKAKKKEVVQAGWSIHVIGFFMFRVVRILKLLKRPFHKLLFKKVNLHKNVKKLRLELDRVQIDLDSDPFNVILCKEEAVYV